MRKFWLLSTLPFLLFTNCSHENTRIDPAGYWSDSTGLAIFEIKKNSEVQYEIASSLGSLNGQLVENKVKGITELKDSFSVEIKGDTAIYSILGVSLACHRISKAAYDSLSKRQGN